MTRNRHSINDCDGWSIWNTINYQLPPTLPLNVKVIVTSSSFRDAQRGVNRFLLTRCLASLLNVWFSLSSFSLLARPSRGSGSKSVGFLARSIAVLEPRARSQERPARLHSWKKKKKEINITGSLLYRNMLQVSYGLWSVSPSLKFWVHCSRINGTPAVAWWVANGRRRSGSSVV